MGIGNEIVVKPGKGQTLINHWSLEKEHEASRERGRQGMDFFTARETAVTTSTFGYQIITEGLTEEQIGEIDIRELYLVFAWQTGLCGHSCGIGGMQAEVDLVRGGRVSFPANDVNVHAVYPKIRSEGSYQPNVRVSIATGKEPMGGGSCGAPRRTVPIGEIETKEQSAVIAIPPFATSVVLMPESPMVPNDLTLVQTTNQDATVLTSSFVQGDQLVNQIALVNGAQYVAVINNSADDVIVRAVFLLAIG